VRVSGSVTCLLGSSSVLGSLDVLHVSHLRLATRAA
jgi:hypothetical protein